MSKSFKLNQQELLDYWDQQKIKFNRSEVEAYLLAPQTHSSFLLVQILSAIGIIFAVIMVLLTLMTSGLLDHKNGASYLVCGSLFLGLGYFINYSDSKNPTTQNILVEQITLAAIAVGKILLCAGIIFQSGVKSQEAVWLLAGTITILTALTYVTINSNIDRFVSSLVTIICIYIAIIFDRTPNIYQTIIDNLFYIMLLILALSLLLNKKLKAKTDPLGFAALIFTCVIIPLWPNTTLIYKTSALDTYTIKASLALGLLVTSFIIAKQQKFIQLDLAILASTLIIICAFFGTHNILAALILLILGHYKFNKTLLALGLLSFIYFLISYYYLLDITLLQKSGLLLTSGTAILFVWAYLHFIKNKKGASQ